MSNKIVSRPRSPFKNTPYGLVLNYGKEYRPVGPVPGAVHGQPQRCFQNSLKLAMENPGMVYVEGFVSLYGCPLHHAWVLGPDGTAYEPTLIPGELAEEDLEYYGVAFTTPYAIKAAAESGIYSLLFNPSFKRILSDRPEDFLFSLQSN